MAVLNNSIDRLVRADEVPLAVKEYISILLILFFCTLLCIQHKIVAVLLASFIVPVLLSTLYAKIKMTRWTYFLSQILLILSSLRMHAPSSRDFGFWIWVEMITASGLLLASYFLAKVLIRYGYNNIAAIISSHGEASKNELAFLQAQIKPHFLYHAINTIVSFCYTDSEKAASLLVNFSKYLRLVFDVDHKSMLVPLEREIEMIKAYVDIEKARFGQQINVEYEIEPALLSMEIPSFCIQPLVENAIKHGLCKKAGGGTVLISVKRSEGGIVIRVSDTGAGMSAEWLDKLRDSESANEGVGFFNVSRRVKSWKAAQLDIQSTEGRGTTVTITVLDAVT